MISAEQYADLKVIAHELESARKLLDEYVSFKGSLTGHIAVAIAAVREEARTSGGVA